MRIIHVAAYKGGFFNGIKSVLENLVPGQRKLGHDVLVLNQEYNSSPLIDGERFVRKRADFVSAIESFKPDVVVLHSLYSINDVVFSWYLHSHNIPYLVEPHGGTSHENAKKNAFKKKIANLVYTKSFIHHAAGLVYLNEKEKDECIFANVRRGATVIPNGTTLHELVNKRKSEAIVKFVFLARIDIIQKGLDLLFPAIEEANSHGAINKTEFHFYGKARNAQWAKVFDDYVSKASKNVFFHGPAIGPEKEKAFEEGDIFILTSRYEGMPMAVLEAMSYGLPCLLTPQTNVTDLIEMNDCGWVADTSVESISSCILKAVDDFKQRREQLMIHSLKAVKPFEWNTIAAKSIQEYSRLISLR